MEVIFITEFKSINRISPLVWELEHIVGKDKAHTLAQTPCKLMVESWLNSGLSREKVKKNYRDKKGNFSEHDKEQIVREMGDVLWYLAALASDLGYNLNDIAFKNTQKILERKDNGKLHGNGDYR